MDKKDQDRLKQILNTGHTLRSRRDFLAHGLLGMTAFALAPSALSLLASRGALAQTPVCAPPVTGGLTPVFIIDLAGGGNIAGSNVIVGGQGGQMDFLADYSTLGLPPGMHPSKPGMLDNEMGLAFHSDSGMLRGIRSVTSVQTRVNCEGAVFCTTSDDDTGNNQHNPMYWLNRAGAKGQLNQLAGTNQSVSGGNSLAPTESVNPSIAPVRIASPQDATNLVSLGKLGNFFTANQSTKIDSLLKAVSNMSNNKLNAVSRRALPEEIKALVACGFVQTPDQIKRFTSTALDPAQDANITAVFNALATDGNQKRQAPIVKLVLDGYIGAGTISMGGYDYHTGERATGEQRDLEAGQLIGRILEAAAKKQKDVMIYVFTDGGVAANGTVDNTAGGRGKFGWGGDSGSRSAAFTIVYKRDGKPMVRNSQRQVGYFKANGSVETAALVSSNSVVNMSKVLVANYLALHGTEGSLQDVVGTDPFRLDLDKYLVFDKLR